MVYDNVTKQLKFDIIEEESYIVNVNKVMELNVVKEKYLTYDGSKIEYFKATIFYAKGLSTSFKFPTFELAKQLNETLLSYYRSGISNFIDAVEIYNEIISKYNNQVFYKTK